jgi:hypothetical protein
MKGGVEIHETWPRHRRRRIVKIIQVLSYLRDYRRPHSIDVTFDQIQSLCGGPPSFKRFGPKCFSHGLP